MGKEECQISPTDKSIAQSRHKNKKIVRRKSKGKCHIFNAHYSRSLSEVDIATHALIRFGQ